MPIDVVSVEEALLWKEAYNALRKAVKPGEVLELSAEYVKKYEVFSLIVTYKDRGEERFSTETMWAIERIEALRYKGMRAESLSALSTTTAALYQHTCKTLICITRIPVKIAKEIITTPGCCGGDLMLDLLAAFTDDVLGSQKRSFSLGDCDGLKAYLTLQSGVLGDPEAQITSKIHYNTPRKACG